MEFTKAEQRILSTKHEKLQKVILWTGILFFCLTIALIPYIINRINKVKTTWEETQTYFKQEINPQTKQEIRLKSMLIDNVKDTKELWLTYITEKSTRMITIFFFVGCFLIGSYFRSRTYIKLIRKLQNS